MIEYGSRWPRRAAAPVTIICFLAIVWISAHDDGAKTGLIPGTTAVPAIVVPA